MILKGSDTYTYLLIIVPREKLRLQLNEDRKRWRWMFEKKKYIYKGIGHKNAHRVYETMDLTERGECYVLPAPWSSVYWMERVASAVPSPRNDCRIGGTSRSLQKSHARTPRITHGLACTSPLCCHTRMYETARMKK